MKTRWMKQIVVVAAICGTILTGCGEKEYTTADVPDMDASKYVTLTEYKGMALTVAAREEITDADVTHYVQLKMNELDQFHDAEGVVEDGDLVNISYVGTIDDVAFDGGTANDQMLQIGSGQYIDGFESGLVGYKAGETAVLNLKFPEQYKEDLAGKDCVFTVTINYVVSDLTNENVAQVDAEYSDVDSYLAAVKSMLQESADYQYHYNLKTAIAPKLIDESTFKNIPESLTASFKKELTDRFTETAKGYDMDLNTFMENNYGLTEDKIDDAFNRMAEQCAKEAIALQAIAQKENIQITEEEAKASLQQEAEAAGAASVDEYIEKFGGTMGDLKLNLMYDKVYDFIIENALITES